MGGGTKPCSTKLLSYLVKNNMERYYPWTWISFVNQKNEKKKGIEICYGKLYIYCSQAIIFQNNWSVYCIPIL